MFRPDPRVGGRQRACDDTHCQRQRRAQTQESWRSRNPSYQKSYRTEKRAARAEAAKRGKTAHPVAPPPLRLPPELTAFPWDVAEATFGFTGVEILTLLAILMVRLVNEVKDERFAEKPLPKETYAASGKDP